RPRPALHPGTQATLAAGTKVLPRHPDVTEPSMICPGRRTLCRLPCDPPRQPMRIITPTRRRILATGAATTLLTAAGGIARPYLSRAADRPQISHGVQSGDGSVDSGGGCARAERSAATRIEVATR